MITTRTRSTSAEIMFVQGQTYDFMKKVPFYEVVVNGVEIRVDEETYNKIKQATINK